MKTLKYASLFATLLSSEILASRDDLTSQATTAAAKPSHLIDIEASEPPHEFVPPLFTVPDEILIDIASRLPSESAVNLFNTCWHLRSIAPEHHIRLCLQSIFQIVCWQNNPEAFKLYV